MFENEIKPRIVPRYLKDYETACRTFSWDDANGVFSWHTTGKCNIAHEAIDRHADSPAKADLVCVNFVQGNRVQKITYRNMRALSNRFGNVLRGLGVKKGDRVVLFLPATPELYIAMVGCAKIGAMIVPFYSDYREGAVKERMLDAQGKVLVTTHLHLKRVPVDELPDLEHVILVGQNVSTGDGNLAWDQALSEADEDLAIEWVERGDPLFLIYTSGQDGTSIGLVHTHDAMRGYLMTCRWVFDLDDGDKLWTQGRPGWFMNVVYSAFAPWLCGVENFVTGKVKSIDELYRLIEQERITVLYTVPTIYRMIIEAGEETARRFDLSSLRHLASVLEPLFPEVIYGVMRIAGLPVYDTWWSAETGMITVANMPCLPIKPGYLGKSVPGVKASVLDNECREVQPFTMGELALKAGWPAMASGIWNNEKLYHRYIRKEPWFMSGDTAFVDYDGYFFYQGRADDVIITSAGKTGLAEVEKAVTMHPAVAEAGVIRIPDEHGIKKIKAFVTLKEVYQPSDLLKKKIMSFVQNNLSRDTAPKEIEFRESLPRDRNGKLLRRVLKAWELGLPTGDISALSGI